MIMCLAHHVPNKHIFHDRISIPKRWFVWPETLCHQKCSWLIFRGWRLQNWKLHSSVKCIRNLRRLTCLIFFWCSQIYKQKSDQDFFGHVWIYNLGKIPTCGRFSILLTLQVAGTGEAEGISGKMKCSNIPTPAMFCSSLVTILARFDKMKLVGSNVRLAAP